jgi:hypothetical protein
MATGAPVLSTLSGVDKDVRHLFCILEQNKPCYFFVYFDKILLLKQAASKGLLGRCDAFEVNNIRSFCI